MRDTNFAAGEQRVYSIQALIGDFNNTPPAGASLAQITGAHDFKVAFASTTQYNGTTTAARGSGAFTASFNTQSAVSTRLYNYHAGPIAMSYEVWGMATDNTGGAKDPHLKTIWHVTVWYNSDASVADIEYAAVVSQDWWGTVNLATLIAPGASDLAKYRLNYDATLKDGATTIETYNTVYHPYHSQWATIRKTDDNNYVKRHWVGTIPTLSYTFDKIYARNTGMFGFFDPVFQPTLSGAGIKPYVPCSAQNERPDIDATGGYTGRGLFPNIHVMAWMLQTPAAMRYMRTDSFAGLHIGYHHRSNYTRTLSSGPQAGTDVANTVMSLIMRGAPTPSYDFTADGMPAPMDAYTGQIGTGYTPAAVSPTTYTPYTGGYRWSAASADFWNIASDTSHAVNYSGMAYLLEGERYFLQAILDCGVTTAQRGNLNTAGSGPGATYRGAAPYATLLSIPNTLWSGIAGHTVGSNVRTDAWGMLLQGMPDLVCPDADVQAGFIKLFRKQNAAYVKWNMGYMPVEQLQIGWYGSGNGSKMVMSPWMNGFQCMAHAWNALANEDANSVYAVLNCGQYIGIAPFENGLQSFRATEYRLGLATKCGSTWDPVTNPFMTRQTMLVFVAAASRNAPITGNKVDFTFPTPSDGMPVYWLRVNANTDLIPIPGGFVEGQEYYLVNSTPTTAQIAATPGGAPLPIESNLVNITSATAVGTVGTFNISGTMPGWIKPGSRFTVTGMVPSGWNGTRSVSTVGTNSFTSTVASSLASTPSTVGGQGSCEFTLAATNVPSQNIPVPTNPAVPPVPGIPADSYAPIANMALIMASKVPGNSVTQTLLNRAAAFVGKVDSSAWVTWKMSP